MKEVAATLAARGFEPDDRISLCARSHDHTANRMAFRSTVRRVADVPTAVRNLGSDDCWLGMAPLREGIASGRGTADDVTGLFCAWADLDVKPGGLPSMAAARQVIADLSDILGVTPVTETMSGHGLQPVWGLEREDGVTDWGAPTDPAARRARSLLRRFGRLVQHVAELNGGNADSVHDLARVLRTPGTSNRKDERAPVRVTVTYPGGALLSMDRLAEVLEEYGVPEYPEDREALDATVSAPAEWTWARRTCPYVRAWLGGLSTDKPDARHPWLVSQYVRLHAAHASGCISEADHERAVRAIGERFTTRLNVGRKRKPAPGEIRGAYLWGAQRAATFTPERARAELGGHVHPDERRRQEHPPVGLAETVATFRQWCGADYDLDVLFAVLSAAAAGMHLQGDPTWLLVVGGSGMTKTESIVPLAAAGAVLASTISSEGALLSGTSDKERSEDATGGLLDVVPDRGVLVLKDMTTILSMGRDQRAAILAALREVYDGRWDRHLGSDGGRTLTWQGHLTLVGAVTTAWDSAHAVVSAMGDRFLLVRPRGDALAAGAAALAASGRETEMRAALAAAVGGLLQHLDPEAVGELTAPVEVILPLANVVTWARTAVERDYRGDVVSAHDREAPTRFAKQLAHLYRGARLLGLDDAAAEALVRRVAADSMPPTRRDLLAALVAGSRPMTTVEVAAAVRRPRTTVDQNLQALAALDLVAMTPDPVTSAWRWSLATGAPVEAVEAVTAPLAPGNVMSQTLSAQSASSASADRGALEPLLAESPGTTTFPDTGGVA